MTYSRREERRGGVMVDVQGDSDVKSIEGAEIGDNNDSLQSSFKQE